MKALSLLSSESMASVRASQVSVHALVCYTLLLLLGSCSCVWHERCWLYTLQEHEVQGDTHTFVLPDSMQADKEAGKFLEANTVNGPHGSGIFGIAFGAISSVAATGALRACCILCLILDCKPSYASEKT